MGNMSASRRGPESRHRNLKLSPSQLWAGIAVAVPTIAVLALSLSAIDLAYLVRAGDDMLRTGHLMRIDSYTFTAFGREWLNQQWGAEILLAAAYRLGGWPALVCLRSALIGFLSLFVFLTSRAASASRRTSSLLTLVAFVAALPGLILRPQLIGLTLFALALWLIATRRAHPRRLLGVPAVTLVWANVHGSFFLAPILLLLAWLQDRRDGVPGRGRVLSLAAISALATLANPFGPRVWTYVAGLATNPTIAKTITEWQPPDVRDPSGAVFFGTVIGVVGLLTLGRRRTAWPVLVSLGVFFALGLTATRSTLWWYPLAATTSAALIADAPAEGMKTEPRSLAGAAIAASLLVAAVIFLPWWRTSGSQVDLLDNAPPRLTAELQRRLEPGSRLFSIQPYASWFEFELREDPVFVDCRIELFPRSVWREYDVVVLGQQGWQRVLDRWRVDAVVATHKYAAGLVPRILADPGWSVAYRGADGYIFLRTP